MKPQDNSEPQSLEVIEARLRRDLAVVQRDLDALMNGEGEYPGDETDAEFTNHVAQIESTIDELQHALDRLANVRPVDLTRIASKTLSDLLLDLEKPLVLTVDWDESVPHPIVPDGALTSVVARMMSLVARFVDAGDEVSLRTLCDRDHAVLRISVTPIEPWRRRDRAEEFRLRCRSLADFVQELGGEFVLEFENEIRSELRLKLGSQVT